MDNIDRHILKILQENSNISLSNLSSQIGISKTPCWNRIQRMEENGIISKRATILNRHAIGLPIVVFLSISVGQHNPEWFAKFNKVVNGLPEIVEAHRLTGSGADYLLKIVSPTIESYDIFQQSLIAKIEFTSMSTSVSLQEIKYQTALPLNIIEPNIP
ncbi:MAG: Lrp/AsnC family transcriptional regulator [Alphaproteobacteria bacterium]|nr:Lrp/AsnC family transcriptional regulator [Alphaproteobacteria bacterium]